MKPSISLCAVLTLAPTPFILIILIGINLQQNPKNKMSHILFHSENPKKSSLGHVLSHVLFLS